MYISWVYTYCAGLLLVPVLPVEQGDVTHRLLEAPVLEDLLTRHELLPDRAIGPRISPLIGLNTDCTCVIGRNTDRTCVTGREADRNQRYAPVPPTPEQWFGYSV